MPVWMFAFSIWRVRKPDRRQPDHRLDDHPEHKSCWLLVAFSQPSPPPAPRAAAGRETEEEAIMRSRRGQGLFKVRVMLIESRCRITGVDNAVHLVASHSKSWRDSTNEERLNGENGLLLTPSIDHLFDLRLAKYRNHDRGFIGFEDSGVLIISPVAHRPSLTRMGIETDRVMNVGGFTDGQRNFLDFHRNSVLLRALR
jgi:putative restriction endonuclease